MFDPAAEPRWMRRCTALALRLGFLPSLAGLSLLLVLGVLGLTQAAVWLIGQGPKPLALLVAGSMALVLSPFLAAWMLQLMFQLDAARQRQGQPGVHAEEEQAPVLEQLVIEAAVAELGPLGGEELHPRVELERGEDLGDLLGGTRGWRRR